MAFLSTRIRASFMFMLTLSRGYEETTQKMLTSDTTDPRALLIRLGAAHAFTWTALRRPCTVLRGR